MNEKNQIRILCANCGCYYYWDITFDFKDYGQEVNRMPKDSNKCCPECGSQEVAEHAHHSAETFNCAMCLSMRAPRYMSGYGSLLEPLPATVQERGGDDRTTN